MSGAPWEDYAPATPPAAGPWADYASPPPSAGAAPQNGGLIKNFGAGFNEAVLSAPGAIIDAVNPILNPMVWGEKLYRDFTTNPFDPKAVQANISANMQAGHGLGDKVTSGLMDLVHPLGLDPRDVKPTSPLEHFARGAGQGASAIIAPESEGLTVGGMLRNAALGAASGVAGTGAADAVPEPYKPFASILGGFLGALAAHGTARAGSAVVRSAADAAAPFVAAISPGAAARQAGQVIASRATSPSTVAELLNPHGAEDLVPGSKPTVFQQTGDVGLGALEREVATQNPADFATRRGEQNSARRGALSGLQSGGDPAAVSDILDKTLQAVDLATARHIDNTVTGARAQVEALGGHGTPEAYGEATRSAIADAENSARAAERGLWRAIDPNGDLRGNVATTRTAARDIVGELPSTAKPLSGEEAAIFDAARAMPTVAPVSDLIALRSRVSTELRNELITNGRSPAYARLSRLRGAIQDNLTSTIGDKIAEESPTAPPQDTIAGRIQGWVDAYRQRQSAATGTDGGPGATAIPEAGAVENAGTHGAGIQSPQGSGGPGSAPRLPSNADNVEFNPGLNRANFGDTHVYYAVPAHGPVEIDLVKTAENARSQGSARAAMQEFLEAADRKGLRVALTPEPVGPGSTVARLTRFYKSLGFKPNSGRSRDFSTRATMLREPQPLVATAPSPSSPDEGATGVPQAGRLFDQDAADRLSAATDATKARARTFGLAPVSNVLNKAGASDLFRLPEARVPEKFFHPGPTGYTDMQAFYRAVGEDKALPIVQDYAASTLRRDAMRPDGTLDPKKFATWQKANSESLRALPDDVRAKFASAGEASRAIDIAIRDRETALEAAQGGAIGRLIGAQAPEDVTRIIGSVLGSKNAVAEMRTLAKATANNDLARQGLRQAVADHMTNKLISNTEVATSGENGIKADAFQSFVRQNRAALATIFSQDELATLDAISRDINRSNRSQNAIRMPGNSNTAQDLYATLRNSKTAPTYLRMLIDIGATTGGHLLGGPLGGILAGAGADTLQSLRASGIDKVQDLVRRAMLDPDVARELLRTIPKKPVAAQSGLARVLRTAAVATSLRAVANGNAPRGKYRSSGSRIEYQAPGSTIWVPAP